MLQFCLRSVVMPRRVLVVALLMVSFVGKITRCEDVATPEQLKYFETHVRPLLVEKCYKCHSDKKQSGELRLDSREGTLQGGESGPAVVVGQLSESLLLDAVNYRSFEMPPDGKLSEDQIGHLTRWVEMGAPWPAGESVAPARPGGRELTDEDRAYWAFQPVRRIEPTVIAGDTWSRSSIDRFIVSKLHDAQLEPAPEADKVTMARRLYLDLTGLPPTLAQSDAFLSDNSEQAYENLVDQLLRSPAYGERMATFWLDLVRYAESDGYRQDAYRPTAWRYRDYVIAAFNADKPFDQFVMEQLAGDEVAPHDPQALAATGYLRHGIYEYNQRDAFGQWKVILEDMTETTADAFLGLGLGCAKCHDHKFDPLLQKDYYRLQAFLCNVSFQDERPLAAPDQLAEYQAQQTRWEEATRTIREKLDALEIPHRKALEKAAVITFQEDFQQLYNKPATERTPYEQQIAYLMKLQVVDSYSGQLDKKFKKDSPERAEWEALKKELAAFDSIKPQELPTTLTVQDVGPVAPVVRIPERPRLGEIAPGFPTVLVPEPARIDPLPGNPHSTGRRTALARWIASPNNPLSTRVIVNRIWALHFGTGLVASVSDFGRLGEPPSHPELLDWLTQEFLDNEWSLKALHKTIVMSAVYRQSSMHPNAPQMMESGMKADPAARLLWRFPIRRLQAEQIRDGMLATSGEIDLTPGGPGVEITAPRRSVYLQSRRNTREPLLEAFDQPDRIAGTGSRNVTTSPTQSLLMINGDWTLVRARKLAARLQKEVPGGSDSLIRQAYRLAYGRDPQESEIRRGQTYLEQSRPIAIGAAPQCVPMPSTDSPALNLTAESKALRPSLLEQHWIDGDFTVGATVLLRSIDPEANVRTIASCWNAGNDTPGWSLGVTGVKSKHQPRNLILQLVGRENTSARYEVVPSGIHLELNRPYRVAVSVKLTEAGPMGVRFVVLDLSQPTAESQIAEVPHTVLAGVQTELPFVVGGRAGTDKHFWDGLVDDLRFVHEALPVEDLKSSQWPAAPSLHRWTFDGDAPLTSVGGAQTLDMHAGSEQVNPWLVDFCHVLLNSNEFLYID
ncbi:MAG: DUF1553 domain-containing protein [Planctomycetota bacterium]|nr:MAG: DUF1553 domain-containing protein [Planctomycetota bacterium]